MAIRKSKVYFFQGVDGPTGRRFRTENEPTRATYEQLFDSLPFLNDAGDTAIETEAGHIKAETDIRAITRAGAHADLHTRAILAYQLPDLITTLSIMDVIDSTVTGRGISIGYTTYTPIVAGLGGPKRKFYLQNTLVFTSAASTVTITEVVPGTVNFEISATALGLVYGAAGDTLGMLDSKVSNTIQVDGSYNLVVQYIDSTTINFSDGITGLTGDIIFDNISLEDGGVGIQIRDNIDTITMTSTYVRTSGDRTLAGTITFTVIPICAVVPTINTHLTNKLYVDTLVGAYLPLAGGTMVGVIAMGTNKITGVGDGTNTQDVCTFGQLTLQGAYTGGQTIAITGGNTIALSSADTTNNDILTLTQNDITNNTDAIQVNQNTRGRGFDSIHTIGTHTAGALFLNYIRGVLSNMVATTIISSLVSNFTLNATNSATSKYLGINSIMIIGSGNLSIMKSGFTSTLVSCVLDTANVLANGYNVSFTSTSIIDVAAEFSAYHVDLGSGYTQTNGLTRCFHGEGVTIGGGYVTGLFLEGTAFSYGLDFNSVTTMGTDIRLNNGATINNPHVNVLEITETYNILDAIHIDKQSSVAILNLANVITFGHFQDKIIQSTPGAPINFTLDTGANYETSISGAGLLSGNATMHSMDLAIINLSGANVITMVAAAGFTIVGNVTIAVSSSALFRFRRSAVNTYVLYRLS